MCGGVGKAGNFVGNQVRMLADWCDMIMNQFQIFQHPEKKANSHYVVEKINKRIESVMEKQHYVCFPDSVPCKYESNGKEGPGVDNGKDPVTHEELDSDQQPESELE